MAYIKKSELLLQLRQSEDYLNMGAAERQITEMHANAFLQSRLFIYSDAEEIQMETMTGTIESWDAFLNLPVIVTYCTQSLLQSKAADQRKMLRTLVKEGGKGSIQATKAAMEIFTGMEQKHKPTIICHYIPRPSTKNDPSNLPKKEQEALIQKQKEEMES